MDGDLKLPRRLPPLPPQLEDGVAVNETDRVVFVESRRRAHPSFLSWLDTAQHRGWNLTVEVADLDEIGAMRRQGHRVSEVAPGPGAEQAALENRDAAWEILKAGSETAGISDIDIRRRGDHTEILFKCKGSWRVFDRRSQAEGEAIDRAVVQGIATTSDSQYLPLAEQDAEISGPEIEALGLTAVRIIRGPAAPYGNGGGHMTMRLQSPHVGGIPNAVKRDAALPLPRRPEEAIDLKSKGYSSSQVERLLYLTEGTAGTVIFTGPMGSGKTSIMYMLLHETARRSPDLKQVTIERPIEFPLWWGTQIPVVGNFATIEAEGQAFADKMRSVLRMAADIILVGEIRTGGVAIVFFEAGRLGHRVYGTLHVDDPYQVPERIELWDHTRLNRRVFCDHKLLRGIVNQRLVPMVCPRCSTPLRQSPEGYVHDGLAARLRSYGDLSEVRVRGPGCADCNYDGLIGRQAAAEIVVTDEELMKDFLEGSMVARARYREREHADPAVMKTVMFEHVLTGRACPVDVNKFIDTIPLASRVNG